MAEEFGSFISSVRSARSFILLVSSSHRLPSHEDGQFKVKESCQGFNRHTNNVTIFDRTSITPQTKQSTSILRHGFG